MSSRKTQFKQPPTVSFKFLTASILTHFKVDFQIKVLTTNSWPYKSSNPVKLPVEVIIVKNFSANFIFKFCQFLNKNIFQLNKCRERFLTFYNTKHSGRKITWVWTQCRGDIKMQPRQSSNPYIFTVSLLFENNSSSTKNSRKK